jgi:hypothetical protein
LSAKSTPENYLRCHSTQRAGVRPGFLLGKIEGACAGGENDAEEAAGTEEDRAEEGGDAAAAGGGDDGEAGAARHEQSRGGEGGEEESDPATLLASVRSNEWLATLPAYSRLVFTSLDEVDAGLNPGPYIPPLLYTSAADRAFRNDYEPAAAERDNPADGVASGRGQRPAAGGAADSVADAGRTTAASSRESAANARNAQGGKRFSVRIEPFRPPGDAAFAGAARSGGAVEDEDGTPGAVLLASALEVANRLSASGAQQQAAPGRRPSSAATSGRVPWEALFSPFWHHMGGDGKGGANSEQHAAELGRRSAEQAVKRVEDILLLEQIFMNSFERFLLSDLQRHCSGGAK